VKSLASASANLVRRIGGGPAERELQRSIKLAAGTTSHENHNAILEAKMESARDVLSVDQATRLLGAMTQPQAQRSAAHAFAGSRVHDIGDSPLA